MQFILTETKTTGTIPTHKCTFISIMPFLLICYWYMYCICIVQSTNAHINSCTCLLLGVFFKWIVGRRHPTETVIKVEKLLEWSIVLKENEYLGSTIFTTAILYIESNYVSLLLFYLFLQDVWTKLMVDYFDLDCDLWPWLWPLALTVTLTEFSKSKRPMDKSNFLSHHT